MHIKIAYFLTGQDQNVCVNIAVKSLWFLISLKSKSIDISPMTTIPDRPIVCLLLKSMLYGVSLPETLLARSTLALYFLYLK